MARFPLKLSEARILISNDDGIHSHGIKVLEEIVRKLTKHVWVVAPEHQQSAAGHSLTIHEPLRIQHYDDRHVSVYGTPTDSVLMGVQKIMGRFRPHLVLSGINHGQNTGDSVTYSGTLAAAMEGALLGVPSIAFSQDEENGKPDWGVAREWLPKILKGLSGKPWHPDTILSVNFPSKLKKGAGLKVVPHLHSKSFDYDLVECVDPRGKPYFWIGPQPEVTETSLENDVGALKMGHVTMTPLYLNLTHERQLKELKGIFA